MAHETATATVGGGCFWCIEAAFKQLSGVESAVSGYAGGETADPGYREVCSGQTGHAEVVQVTYDPEEFSYADLLEVFFAVHAPTSGPCRHILYGSRTATPPYSRASSLPSSGPPLTSTTSSCPARTDDAARAPGSSTSPPASPTTPH